jgi:hypothetical protein
MNLWRWLGATLFLVSLTCLISAGRPAVYAGEKDKKEEKKDDTKKEEKKDDTKKEEKKDDTKKVDPPKGSGTTFTLSAFENKDKAFFQAYETDTTQTMKVMGQEVVQKQKQTFFVQWTPKAKAADGSYVVDQKIIGVVMDIDIGGNKISYDSRKQQPKNPMTEFFGQLIDKTLTFTISPKLKVTSIEGRKALVDALGATNPQMVPLLNSILSEDALKLMAEPTWAAVPPNDAVAGKTEWESKSTLNLGPIGSYDSTFKFKYEGEDAKSKGVDKIGITTDVKYAAPTSKSDLPFTIKSANLKSTSGTGEAYFDRAKGRFEKSNITMKLEGSLTIVVGNMETDITLSQVQAATVTTTDVSPVAAETKKQ